MLAARPAVKSWQENTGEKMPLKTRELYMMRRSSRAKELVTTKRLWAQALTIIMTMTVLLLAGCAGGQNGASPAGADAAGVSGAGDLGVDDSGIEAGADASGTGTGTGAESAGTETGAANSGDAPLEPQDFPTIDADAKVDIDLTTLSSTMVFGEVSNMMLDPEDYLGKTIRVRGPYFVNYNEVKKEYLHFVVVTDATACCQNGLNFNWAGEHSYPADYPQMDEEIEIVGVIGNYEEYGQVFCVINTSEIKRV